MRTPTELLEERLFRGINELLLTVMNWHRIDWTELALKFEYGYSADKVYRHFWRDSDNSFVVARFCEIFHLPTIPAEDFLNGNVNKTLRKYKEANGLTTRALVYKVYPGIKPQDVESRLDQLEKFFENGSVDGWRVARLAELFVIPHTPSRLFLPVGPREKVKRARQLYMEI